MACIQVFNLAVVAPLDGLNFLFFLWGLFLCLPQQARFPTLPWSPPFP